MEIVNQARLLGVVINNTLTWDDNTKYLVKRANSRMRILHRLVSFSVPEEDLMNIWQDLSKYTVPTSFAGMSVPTTIVGILVA